MARDFATKAYETLLDRISRGELRPSVPLDIPRIARELEMSTTPVRDAVKRLEADGLVEVIPRSGTFVKHLSLQDLVRGYEYVEALEGMAGLLIGERVRKGELDPKNIDTMSSLVDRMENCLHNDQLHQWSELDATFHQCLGDFCGNELIASSLQSVKKQMKSVLYFISPMYVDRHNSVREHRAIIAALRAGDGEKARHLCQAHRSLVRHILMRVANTLMGVS